MSGRCGHPDGYRTDRAIFRIGHDVVTTMRTWWADGERIAQCEVNRCTWCGAWLPLGHSDETPERVAIEIRAAGMYACHATDGKCECFAIERRLAPISRERQARELADEMMAHWQSAKETP